MQILDVKQESYFPQNFKIFGVILIFGSIASLVNAPSISALRVVITLLVILLGASMIFARYALRVDPNNKTYTVYTLLLGLEFGKPASFNFIDKFYINQVTEQAQATTRTGAKFDLKNKLFKAYIRLDNGEKLHLDTDKSEEKLKNRLDQYKSIVSSVYKPSE
ncbi:hypothetical protein [Reichenbachiella sp.]|uniref:hypothetical protein n=1 Tax=Reichenbachiella sp. TaxID=2184521 RepID=UPI003B5928DE